MPLGQTVCGTEGCFIPLAGPIGRKMGKTPPIYHQHMRGLIRITRNCSSRERQTFHTSATSPRASSVMPLAEAKPPPVTSPAREKLNFAVPMQHLLNGGRGHLGQPSFPRWEPPGRWARAEAGRATQGSLSTRLPHLSAADANPFPGVLAEQGETLLRPPARRSFRLLSRRSLCS